MKHCSKCDLWKSKNEFTVARHNKDGLNSWCKMCTRRNSYNGYSKNREERTKQIKQYRNTEKGKDVSRQAVVKWIQSNPKKYIAHLIVKTAKKYGVVEVKPCEVCGDINVHAHHKDYDRPFEVTWLCSQHHKEIHI